MKTIQLSNTQLEAADQIEKWYKSGDQTFYLAGYAGTGKTTIVNKVIQNLREQSEEKIKPVYCAFTGKAASVLDSKGNTPACTVHSLIYVLEERQIQGKDGKFVLKKAFVKRPLEPRSEFEAESLIYGVNLIVLDECSMISTELYNDLKSFGHKILILGDPGQLPPIAGESPFGKSDYFLYEIQRQAKESNIIQIATLARQSEPIPKCKHDDAFVGSVDFFEDIWKPGTQVLCGTNKTRFAYNKLIRESLLYGTTSHYPLPGEEIICLENNRALNMFNGQVVTCRHHELLDRQAAGEDVNELSYKDLSKVQLTFETETGMVDTILADFRHFKASSTSDEVKLKALKREKEEFMKSHQPFDFAHCVTVHKSQGSQWNEVIVIDESKVFRDKSIKAKWLYTAITRAAKKIHLLR